jgi:MFS family permease
MRTSSRYALAPLAPLTRLLTPTTLNKTSGSILLIAMPLVAITALDATLMEVGVIAAAGTAAPLLFGLSAGAMADRLDRTPALFWCGVARLLLDATLALLFALEQMTVAALCVVSFGLSAAKLLFDSVVVAVIPTIVPRNELAKANGWFEALNSTAYSLGSAIAGWLLQFTSAVLVFTANSVLYLVSTLCLKGVSLPRVEPELPYERSHFADIASGIRLLWRNEIQRTVAFSAGAFNACHAAFFTVFTFHALKELQFSAASFGTVVSLVGLTGLAGALCAPRLIETLGARTALIGSLLVIGPLGVPILFAGHLPFPHRAMLIAACLAAWDFMIVGHIIIEQTMRQIMVDNRHLSRMTATTRFISWGADPVGTLLGGMAATTALGSHGTLVVCLFGFVVSAAVLLTSKGIRAPRNQDLGLAHGHTESE